MSTLWSRYWHSLSPALRRYYCSSLLPSVLFLALTLLHKFVSRAADAVPLVRWMAALAPVVAMAWLFALYLRFLRDCDELERRIELGALAWAAGIVLHASMAAMLLLDARLVGWSGRHVAAWLCMLLVVSYALIRGWLHRKYA
jgi:hypothetical protein